MFKIVFYLLFISASLLAKFDIDQNTLNKMKQVDLIGQLEIAESFSVDSEYLTKSEFKEISSKLKEYYKKEKNKKPTNFLLYFFSSSVPKESVSTVLHEVGVLQENGINLKTIQYFVGLPDAEGKILKEYKNYIESKKGDVGDKIRKNFKLKINTDFFHYYDIEKVPVLALARCQNNIPDIKQCKVNYLMRGDTNLINFFDKISNREKYFEKFVRILEANGIYEEFEKEVKENVKIN